MRRSGSRKFLWYGSVMLALATVVIAVASAQAAPALKKNFEASVRIENATESHSVFRLTMKNDPASQQTLGSAQFALPAGFALVGTPATNVSTGFSVRYLGGNIAEFDANSSGTALKAGGVATADVAITLPSACLLNDGSNSALWKAAAKQSNDFSGSGNDFTRLAVSSDGTFRTDLLPLGSFDIATIATVADATYPTVLTDEAFPFVTRALDTCGGLKADYKGAALTYSFLTNAAFHSVTAHQDFAPADYGSVAWSGGSANVQVTPVTTETPNTLTVTDGATQIASTSNAFDVVDLACTKNTPLCTWTNSNKQITATTPSPTTDDTSIGIGFNDLLAQFFTCGGKTSAIGGSIVNLAPHFLPTGATTYRVTLTYTKSASGNGPASGFVVCLVHQMPTDSAAWSVSPAGDCPATPSATDAPCVVGKKRISGGALQIILFLDQSDPWGGVG